MYQAAPQNQGQAAQAAQGYALPGYSTQYGYGEYQPQAPQSQQQGTATPAADVAGGVSQAAPQQKNGDNQQQLQQSQSQAQPQSQSQTIQSPSQQAQPYLSSYASYYGQPPQAAYQQYGYPSGATAAAYARGVSYPGSATGAGYSLYGSMPVTSAAAQPVTAPNAAANTGRSLAATGVPSASSLSPPAGRPSRRTHRKNHNNSDPPLSPSVGQIQPRGIRPKITTIMWEDEKTLCYQVEANGVSVVRRADNDMINGTKLLNVAKMTRGRRDGILKAEKTRHVVKIGSMHLKGVWIPFGRALLMAQREGIVDLLYPLFVKDIKRVIQQGTPTYRVGQMSLDPKHPDPSITSASAAVGPGAGADSASGSTSASAGGSISASAHPANGTKAAQDQLQAQGQTFASDASLHREIRPSLASGSSQDASLGSQLKGSLAQDSLLQADHSVLAGSYVNQPGAGVSQQPVIYPYYNGTDPAGNTVQPQGSGYYYGAYYSQPYQVRSSSQQYEKQDGKI
ncbi:DEKNAAC102619 [Brettanomyces naardenensis]|uniref:DEKNAAC102619 n=1 Tax=Brettanomyces naardenensis TaxID=13370 RepID=A0A448YKU8_BRENA|nr:DEKNAAC102619 [Brettanomyces naardenensis]